MELIYFKQREICDAITAEWKYKSEMGSLWKKSQSNVDVQTSTYLRLRFFRVEKTVSRRNKKKKLFQLSFIISYLYVQI